MTGTLAIQIIQLEYTDDHRGAADAAKRERLRALPLAGSGVLQRCIANAAQGFEPRSTTVPLPAKPSFDTIELQASETLSFTRDSKPLFDLPAGEWARIVWNAKYVSYDSKWLVEFVLNAGLFAATPSANVFFGTPARKADLRR